MAVARYSAYRIVRLRRDTARCQMQRPHRQDSRERDDQLPCSLGHFAEEIVVPLADFDSPGSYHFEASSLAPRDSTPSRRLKRPRYS